MQYLHLLELTFEFFQVDIYYFGHVESDATDSRKTIIHGSLGIFIKYITQLFLWKLEFL